LQALFSPGLRRSWRAIQNGGIGRERRALDPVPNSDIWVVLPRCQLRANGAVWLTRGCSVLCRAASTDQGGQYQAGYECHRVGNPHAVRMDAAVVKDGLRDFSIFAVARKEIMAIFMPSVNCVTTQARRNSHIRKEVQNADRYDENAQSLFSFEFHKERGPGFA
jgi:hypothetical protein